MDYFNMSQDNLSPELPTTFKTSLTVATEQYVQAMMEHAALTSHEKTNMEGSGARMAKALCEIILDRDTLINELKHTLGVGFPIKATDTDLLESTGTVNQTNLTLVQPNIKSVSLCPHHFLPVRYKTFIAILVPARGGVNNDPTHGWVYGLSKYVRAVELLARRPVLQEQYTRDIVELFTNGIIGGEIAVGNNTVIGCMVIVEGDHGCMSCRGVKTDTNTVTHYSLGLMDDEQQIAWNLYRNATRN